MATRAEIYAAIDGERDYQDRRWAPEETSTGGRHSVAEFAIFIDDYLREMKTQLSRNAEPGASARALETLRKITAMGVACMEQHGAPRRVLSLTD